MALTLGRHAAAGVAVVSAVLVVVGPHGFEVANATQSVAPRGYVSSIVIDRGARGIVYASTLEHGVFASSDRGRTWHASSTGLPKVRVDTLAVDPSRPRVVYAGTGLGVFKSTNGGRSWQRTSTSLTAAAADSLRHRRAEGFVFSLVVDPGHPDTLYAGTSEGVFRSRDGGRSWQRRGLRGRYVISLAVDPTGSGAVYAGASTLPLPGRVFKTDDGGSTWRPLGGAALRAGNSPPMIVALPGDEVFAGTASGLYRSTNGGQTWVGPELPSKLVTALAVERGRHSVFYVGTSDGLLKSGDSGVSWDESGLQTLYVSAITLDPRTHRVVYAGTNDGLRRSGDRGVTWVWVR